MSSGLLIVIGAGALLLAGIVLLAAALWLRRSMVRLRTEVLHSASHEARALGSRLAVLEGRLSVIEAGKTSRSES